MKAPPAATEEERVQRKKERDAGYRAAKRKGKKMNPAKAWTPERLAKFQATMAAKSKAANKPLTARNDPEKQKEYQRRHYAKKKAEKLAANGSEPPSGTKEKKLELQRKWRARKKAEREAGKALVPVKKNSKSNGHGVIDLLPASGKGTIDMASLRPRWKDGQPGGEGFSRSDRVLGLIEAWTQLLLRE